MNDELRATVLRAFCVTPSPQLRYQRGGRHLVSNGLTFAKWDVHDPSNNTVTALGPTPEPEYVLAMAAEFFADRPNGWGVVVEAGAEHPLEQAVRARGWRVIEEEPMLALAPIAAAPPSSPLPICRVTTESLLTDYYGAARSGFSAAEAAPPDSPEGEDLTTAFIPSLACALDPEIALFVGQSDGRVVGTSGLCRVGDVAKVFGVSVVPEFRRRGLGAALTWAAIAAGAERGCTAAALMASPMGEPVYRGMGFEFVCRLRAYAPPPDSIADRREG